MYVSRSRILNVTRLGYQCQDGFLIYKTEEQAPKQRVSHISFGCYGQLRHSPKNIYFAFMWRHNTGLWDSTNSTPEQDRKVTNILWNFV